MSFEGSDYPKLAGGFSRGWLSVIAQGSGAAGVQATAKVPSTRARMAFQADWRCKRAVPVTDR